MSDAPASDENEQVATDQGESGAPDEPTGASADVAASDETPAAGADDGSAEEEAADDASDAAGASPSAPRAADGEQSYGGLALTRSEEELRVRMQSGEIFNDASYAQAHRSYGMTSSLVAPRGRERRENGVSVSYRRFPALAQLSDLELASVTVAPTQQLALGMSSSASSAQLGHGSELDARARPELEPFSALSSFRAAVIKKGARASLHEPKRPPPVLSSHGQPAAAPFRPINPRLAREVISERKHGYVTMHTPYSAAMEAERQERARARAAQYAGAFKPTSAAKAKTSILVNYFLNSPDTETFEAERQFIKERADKNLDGIVSDLRSKTVLLREREKKQEAELLAEYADGARFGGAQFGGTF